MTTTLSALRRGDLVGTRELALDNCGLTACPEEVFALADSLEVLDLSGNALTALPNDFSRLHRLRILFCSRNEFAVLPPVLGDCAALGQVGFRGSGLREVPADSLPPAIRWLTLTDNHLTALPSALGDRPLLQKLMLAGNRLAALPDSLADAGALELLRLSANRFDRLPPWLAALPRLAWLAWAGNPFDRGMSAPDIPIVEWRDLLPGAMVGEGASGWVHQAVWRPGEPPGQPIAVKLFKGAMTSDGLPEREMAASLAAGPHPNLVSALGRLAGHPDRKQGLAMPLVPAGWQPLAGPPSRESCSRDVYDPALRLDYPAALRIAAGIAAAAAHLHAHGLMHGDLYAHNILWDGAAGAAVLSDFGAASFFPDADQAGALKPIEVLAWGLLLGELLDRCGDVPDAARSVQQRCVVSVPSQRPTLPEALDALGALA